MWDELRRANKHYAASFSFADLALCSPKHLAIVTCMDVRIEPLSIFNLEIGDANLIRNGGGRVTDDVIRSLLLATTLLEVSQIVVLHHTGCALARRSDDEVRALVAKRDVTVDSERELLAMPDPDFALASDVQSIVDSPALPPGIVVTGWRYDIATGLVSEIVTPVEKTH